MKNSSQNGSTITQYIIIIALVCLVCIPAFFILGKNLFDYFNSFKSGMQNESVTSITYSQQASDISDENTEENTANNNIEKGKKGYLVGNPAQPQKECKDGLCYVDYGDFILKGVPSDLGEHLKVSGSSGVTDYMAELLDQITEQAEDSDLLESEINLIKNLSNICHQIAVLESQLENNAQTLVNRYNQNGYFKAESGANTFYQDKMTQLTDLRAQMSDVIDQMKSDEILNKVKDTDFAQKYDVVLQLGKVVACRVKSFDQMASQLNGGINDEIQLNTINELLEFSAAYKTKEDSQKICSQADGQDTGVECK